MQAQARWNKERVLQFLKEFYGVEEWEDKGLGDDIYLPATGDRPAIYYDSTTNKLAVEYPDEHEELPSPYSRRFYPDLEEEIKSPDDIDKLKDYLDDETVEEIRRTCGNSLVCILESAYAAIAEDLESQLKREISRLENAEPVTKVFCGIPVTKKTEVYEEIRDDGITEYTAYIPSVIYTIDLDKVPNEATLACVLDKIAEDA